MSNEINKVVCIGRGSHGRVFCTIKFDGERLSITGVEGPKGNGDCRGGCGQIQSHIVIKEFYEGWDYVKLDKFLEIWERWHLNDMTAGTPNQEAALRSFKRQGWNWRDDNPMDSYLARCNKLESVGLLSDNGYVYGHKWLLEEVPTDVIDFLSNLPTNDHEYPRAWR